MRLLAYVCDVVAKLATTISRAQVAINGTLRFIPLISTISYKSIMSSESSFDGQTFNEFDDFLPKPLSTDSDSDHVDPEPTGATTSSQAPLTSVQHHLKHQWSHQHHGYRCPSSPLKLLQFKVQTFELENVWVALTNGYTPEHSLLAYLTPEKMPQPNYRTLLPK